MNDPQPPAPAATPAARRPPGLALGLVALLLAAAGGIYAYTVYSQPDAPPPDELVALKSYITHLGQAQKLKDGYADANGDLVADPPTDPAKFLTVDEIAFSAFATDDPDDLAGGRYDAVCVASDLCAAEVKAGTVREDQFRQIGREGPFPPLCFGVPHHLPPALRKQVDGVFEGFRTAEPAGGKFARVDYALNRKTVRDIDSSLSRLLDGR